jgi:hypothetical protein
MDANSSKPAKPLSALVGENGLTFEQWIEWCRSVAEVSGQLKEVADRAEKEGVAWRSRLELTKTIGLPPEVYRCDTYFRLMIGCFFALQNLKTSLVENQE